MRCFPLWMLGLGLFTSGVSVLAADWPQWRGPDRTDVSKETGLLKTWPKTGPKLLWTFNQAGIGYAGPAIVGDTLYSMGQEGNDEFLFAVDVATGQQKWRIDIGRAYENNWGGGPRGTPTVDGDCVYAIGANGDLVCVKIDGSGKRWSKSFPNDFGGQIPTWGYCESPLIDGDKLVCTPGGDRGTMVALDKKTGELIWASTGLEDRAAYSSIVAATIGKTRQYIQMVPGGVVGIHARSGKLLWRDEAAKNSTAVIPTPVVMENLVFVSSGYGAGCGLIRLEEDGQGGIKSRQLYTNKNMINHHGGVVRMGKYLYGYTDANRGAWICQDMASGKVLWSSTKLDKGSLTCADGQFYCYGEKSGSLVRIQASPKGWLETGRFTIPQKSSRRKPAGGIWTHPVIANGKLYLRDQELLFCYDLKQK